MIKLKTKEEIEILRQGGHILAEILRSLTKAAVAGVGTDYLEELALKLIAQAGGKPAFKNYHMGGGIYFPTALCVSINDEVVHGPALPKRVLCSGDIVDLDIGMEWQGLYTDTCYTKAIGPVSRETRKFLRVSEEALYQGIKMAKAGNTLNDIGVAIENYCQRHGYGVVRDLVGHGVGYQAHEDPEVYNYEIGAKSPENIVLEPGLVIAIEPMVNLGAWQVKVAENGYTVLTADGSLSAHFEHTIVIGEKGPEILTK